MNNKTTKLSPSVMWAIGVLIALVCATGIAAIVSRDPSESPKEARESTAALATSATSAKPSAKDACQFCGVVELTRVVNVKGNSNGVGAVGGAVVGGLLGHQVGGGSGKDIATVAGAVGGAYAGNEIEKNMKSGKHYETTVRFDEGGRRVFTSDHPLQWREGDRVRVAGNTIVSR